MKKALVACEESQTVTKAFRRKGFEAFSCDFQPCSGGHPEWHIQGDVLDLLIHNYWDLLIAHPPCTYLSNSSVCWLYKQEGRWFKLNEGAVFFKKLLKAPIPMKAVENPIPHKYAVALIGRKYDQLVQPYMFGHMERKATCFWLEGLPKLEPTNNVYEEMLKLPKNKQQRLHYLPPGKNRAKLRSKTFEGIAEAMAVQWGGMLMGRPPLDCKGG